MNNTMGAFALPLGITLLGNCLYHLTSREVSTQGAPFSILAIVYLFGCIAATLIAFSVESANAASFGRILAAPWALLLAAAVLMIEVGFLFAYRAGAPISTSSLLVNASVAVILALVGVVALREPFSWKLLLGLALTIGGVILIASSQAEGASRTFPPESRGL